MSTSQPVGEVQCGPPSAPGTKQYTCSSGQDKVVCWVANIAGIFLWNWQSISWSMLCKKVARLLSWGLAKARGGHQQVLAQIITETAARMVGWWSRQHLDWVEDLQQFETWWRVADVAESFCQVMRMTYFCHLVRSRRIARKWAESEVSGRSLSEDFHLVDLFMNTMSWLVRSHGG